MVLPAKLAALATLGAAAYLGLAVLGSGGFAAFFSHPQLIVVALVLFALAAASLFTAGNLSAGQREDRQNRWVLPVFGVIGLLSAYVPAYTDRIGFWTLDGESVRWLGVALFAAGGALRNLARLRARPPVQRAGRDPAGTYIGDGRCVRRDPSPELSRLARQRAGVGAGLPVRRWCAADRGADPAACRAHPRRGTPARLAIRGRIRGLPPPHLAAHSRAYLTALARPQIRLLA